MAMSSQTSGEAGIILAPLTQPDSMAGVMAQLVFLIRFALLRSMRDTYRKLRSFGNVFSTVSAQFSASNFASARAPAPTSSTRAPVPREGVGTTDDTGGTRLLTGAGGGSSEPGFDERAASYSRYSSDLQSEDSIGDQQRRCRENAAQLGHRIPPELEFHDEAVSGAMRNRVGLDSLMASARQRRFSTLYFFNLSRLARESVIAMPLLKELVYVYHVRIISVSEGIDSDRDGWDLLATLLSVQHERFLKDLSANVLKGQEGTVLATYCVGDWCFGYTSIPDPQGAMRGRGRNAKPRMVYAIDAETASWVRRIFNWFVVDQRSVAWITRELNRLGAPKDHRATTRRWYATYVTRLLKNSKYVGVWPWGEMKNARNPLTGQISQEPRPVEQTERWVREFPHLRIIADDVREAALRRLAEHARRAEHRRTPKGRLNGSKTGNAEHHPRHLLSRLIHCAQCGAIFQASGSYGKYLSCPAHEVGDCNCKTQLRRDLAERLILNQIGERILSNPTWLESVQSALLRRHADLQRDRPSELGQAESALQTVDQKIVRLLDLVEAGDAPTDVHSRLRQRQAEKRDLTNQIAALRRMDASDLAPPTDEWVRERLTHLHEVLTGGGPAAALALRRLVGGRIRVAEVQPAGCRRPFLQGRFTVNTAGLIRELKEQEVANQVGLPETCGNDEQAEIVIDFRTLDHAAQLADGVKSVWDEGLTCQEIALRIGRSRTLVRKAIRYWHATRGLPLPDGRSLRKRLKVPTRAATIMDDVMRLWNRGLSYTDIATELKCDRNVITAAVKLHFRHIGEPVPDGRARRKQLREQRERESDRHPLSA